MRCSGRELVLCRWQRGTSETLFSMLWEVPRHSERSPGSEIREGTPKGKADGQRAVPGHWDLVTGAPARWQCRLRGTHQPRSEMQQRPRQDNQAERGWGASGALGQHAV